MSSSSGELSNEAADWFEKGLTAMNQQDWDSAVKCLSSAVRLNPDELEYRNQKHRSCRRKFKKTGSVSKLNSLKLVVIRARIRRAKAREDWAAVDQLAEDGIAIDPRDAEMFACIADAATQVDRVDIAKHAWACAVKLDWKNAAYFQSFGAVLQDNGELEMARSCFQTMLAIDPTSRIAEELLQDAEVALHLETNRFATVRNGRNVGVGPQDHPGPRTVQEPPPVVEPKLVAFLTLAEHHARRKAYAKSIEAWQRALEIAPGDRSIQTRMENAELAFLQQRVTDARNSAKQHPTCGRRRETATALMTELRNRGIQILAQRVQDNPNDLVHTYHLADFYRQVSELEKAIQLFEKVCADRQLQAEARIGIGECCVRSGQAEPGRQNLEAALLQVDRTAQPKAFKLAHYWLGRLYEFQTDYAMAVNHYGEITAVDRNFRDVVKRLKVLNTITWP